MPSPKAGKRGSRRITINKEFRNIDDFIAEYVTNISATGAFIRSKNPLPIGTLVNLRFSVILDEIETIEGVGKIVRVEKSPERESGMGVVFIKLNSYSQKLIEKIFTYQPGRQD